LRFWRGCSCSQQECCAPAAALSAG
jgi:hypothetical protein